jgi:release factor glutamine methyltransferase
VADAARSPRSYWWYMRASGWHQARPDAAGTVNYEVAGPEATPRAHALDAVSVGGALAHGRAKLEHAGCGTPRLDAELLLAAALNVGRERLVMDRDATVDQDARARYRSLLTRRAAREPVAYILGRKPFRHISLTVDRRALIPRPETELLVEVGLTLAPGSVVADVGCGSGAVALALEHERPDLCISAIELDADALALARGNAVRMGLDVRFVAADLLDDRRYDAVLANLPYVATGTVLQPEITRYEPAAALFAGADGLDAIRRLTARLSERPSVTVVALEIGADQAAAVTELVVGGGFGSTEVLRDLAGYERIVVGRR